MATTVARLEAILTANTRDFDRAMNQSESKMHKIGKVAGVAGLAIAGGIAVGLEKSVKAAIEAQQAEARLTQAYKNAHVAIAPLRGQIERLEAAGRKLGFTDEQTTVAMGSLITATRNQKLATKDLTVAQGLARFKHVQLEDATKMLTMAMTGSQRAAKQLGISVQPVTKTYDALKATMGKTIDAHEKLLLAQAKLHDKQLTGIAVVDAVRDHVKGQAQAYSETAAGAMESFKAQLQHIEVEIGNKLLPAMMKAVEWIKANWPAISAVIKRVWVSDIKPTLDALGQLVISVVELIRKHWGTIGPIVMQAAKVLKDMLRIVTDAIKLFTAILRGDWSEAWKQLKNIVFDNLTFIKDRIILMKDVFVALMKGIGTAMWGAIKAAFNGAWGEVKDAVSGLFHKIVGWIKDFLGIKSPSTVFHGIGQSMILGLISGVGSMAGALKHKVVDIVKHIPGAIGGLIGGVLHGGAAHGSQQNRNIGQQLAARYGWSTGPEWVALDALFNQESGWNNKAKNKSSGAYGIAQALPPTKMPFAAQEAGGSNAAAQIDWGLRYIKSRYGDPMTAWGGYWQRGGWYGKGGVVTKPTILGAGESGPEAIIPLGGLSSGGSWQSRYYDFMQRVWQFARPYFPNALGPMPPVTFTQGLDSLFVGTDFTPDAHGNIPPPGKRTLYWPKWLSFFANRDKAVAAYETLIHEWAHEFQDVKATQGIRLGEGGAEAFAEAHTPAIYRGLGFNIKPAEVKGIMGNYYGYVKWVLAHKGMNWVDKGQFGVFDKGGWLQPGLTMAYNGTGQPERVGGGDVVIPVSIGGEHVATVIFDQLRRKAKVFENRNGRPAFGGA